MKKADQMVQMVINATCLQAIKDYNKYVEEHNVVFNWERLDHCTAWTADIGDYEVLRSYETLIAMIHKPTGVMYDVLRYVYGYTATSAKHIAKFRRSADTCLTYRPI